MVSLFCGACSVESALANSFDFVICNDINTYLIELLRAVQGGFIPPETVTREEYKYIREHPDENKALTAFCGFGCSFGGKWFGGYANDNNGRNYAREAKESLLKDMASLRDATFSCMDYRDVSLPEGCVIYADPPYAGTTQYRNGVFDTRAFWDYAIKTSQNHMMFISEQTAPDDFVVVWEKGVKRTLDFNKENQPQATEKLFIHKKYMHNL